jgi:hypothetical protein
MLLANWAGTQIRGQPSIAINFAMQARQKFQHAFTSFTDSIPSNTYLAGLV